MKRLAAFVVVGGALAWLWWTGRTISQPDGSLAPCPPAQRAMDNAAPIEYKGYKLTPRATFELEARVLSVRRYRFGRESELSPLDLALGWGPMSDNRVIDQLKISQGDRFYMYYWRHQPPIPVEEIVRHSSNMHLIPSDKTVWSRMKRLRRGHVIRMNGYLVYIYADDGWYWRSSLTRTDSGAGACEVVWVLEIDTVEKS